MSKDKTYKEVIDRVFDRVAINIGGEVTGDSDNFYTEETIRYCKIDLEGNIVGVYTDNYYIPAEDIPQVIISRVSIKLYRKKG